MIRLIDGPAAGIELAITRMTIMLRLARSPLGWRALDGPNDDAGGNEAVFVYVLEGQPVCADIHGRRHGHTSWNARYRLFPIQPGDQHTRGHAAWSNWCDSIREEVQAWRQEQAVAGGERA